MPSAASEVTPLSAMPHGTMWPNIAMSGSTLSAKPCIDRPRESFTPTAQIFRGASDSGATHTPGNPGTRPVSVSPRSASTSITSCSTEHT